MAISIAQVDFQGPPPDVHVRVGFALPATYTIAAVPPNHDFTQALPVVTASTPAQVDAVHSIATVWPAVSEGWLIVVFGGIASLDGAPGFDLAATLTQSGTTTPMTLTLVEGTSAATFLASVELRA